MRVEAAPVSNLQHAQRTMTIARSPSSPGDEQLTLDVSDLIFNSYARNQDRADALGEEVRASLRLQMRLHSTAAGAFIKTVRTLAPPSAAPSDSKQMALSTATYRVYVHVSL